ncbi:RICIN domain-containing protein [Streptomonospora algeriensis]|uniref:RICIN domain-containing protein n=1 Tax=Streptomonospora algeriensis TaxID=995084 RepID=A0ABW3BF88_9ACTN
MAKRNIIASAAAILASTAAAVLMSATGASAAPVQIEEEADYRIIFEKNDAMMVPWGGSTQRTDVRVWPNDYAGMDWDVTYAGRSNGMATYEIRNLRSDLCLQPKDGATQAGKRVEQATCNGRLVQQWNLPHVGDGTRHIVPAKNWNIGVTLENPASTGSFLKLDYRNRADPDFQWNFATR